MLLSLVTFVNVFLVGLKTHAPLDGVIVPDHPTGTSKLQVFASEKTQSGVVSALEKSRLKFRTVAWTVILTKPPRVVGVGAPGVGLGPAVAVAPSPTRICTHGV